MRRQQLTISFNCGLLAESWPNIRLSSQIYLSWLENPGLFLVPNFRMTSLISLCARDIINFPAQCKENRNDSGHSSPGTQYPEQRQTSQDVSESPKLGWYNLIQARILKFKFNCCSESQNLANPKLITVKQQFPYLNVITIHNSNKPQLGCIQVSEQDFSIKDEIHYYVCSIMLKWFL